MMIIAAILVTDTFIYCCHISRIYGFFGRNFEAFYLQGG